VHKIDTVLNANNVPANQKHHPQDHDEHGANETNTTSLSSTTLQILVEALSISE
jgi:hypothetical protein